MGTSYPEWVMKYKTKGTYVIKRKDGYALFRGHSERVEGKKYPRLVCDEYLGMIKEDVGLVPSSPAVKPGIEVWEYGLWAVTDSLCSDVRKTGAKHWQDKELLFRRAFLRIAGEDSKLAWRRQWISRGVEGDGPMRELDRNESATVESMAVQMSGIFRSRFGDDAKEVTALACRVYLVRVNNKWRLSSIPEGLADRLWESGVRIEVPKEAR